MVRIGSIALALVSLSGSALAQKRLSEFRSRFQKETDAVHRAKLMPQLGTAQFEEIDRDLAADKAGDALAILQQYREEADSCSKGLDGKGVNVEKHPAGFKELEFSLRESLRRLDDIIVTQTGDEQGPFRVVRNDLDELDRHIIRELFPAVPDKGPREEKPRD